MPGRFIRATAMHALHPGQFKSVSVLKVLRNVIFEARSVCEHLLCWVPPNVISISKT